MGDVEGFSDFFGIRRRINAEELEKILNPKEWLVNLCRQSRKRSVREAMVPHGSHNIGPGYTSMMIEFASQWRPDAAVEYCSSLRRAMDCVRRLV